MTDKEKVLTPITDRAEVGTCHEARYYLGEEWDSVVDAKVARELERQLAAVTAERDALQESNRQESAAMALLLERECQDGDRLAEALGVPRTEGGSLQVQRMLNVIDALRVDAERYESLLKRCAAALEMTPTKWRNGEHITLPSRIKAAIDAARGAKHNVEWRGERSESRSHAGLAGSEQEGHDVRTPKL